MIVFENREFGSVVAHGDMPVFNQYADQYSLLRQYYAIRHPSLPNYIAMISGDVQGIGSDCTQCFVDAPSLPDLLEKAGLSWRTYQEDMPEPCYLGSTRQYAQKHDPFIYFDAIRLNPDRCQ
jgi:phospholipase C